MITAPAFMPFFLTADQVAACLGLDDGRAFLRRRPALEATALFPLAMPHSRRPLLWKADEVLAWITRNGGPAPAHDPGVDPALIASGKVALLEMARTI